MEGVFSFFINMNLSVPQSSRLRPVFFSLHINDLSSVLENYRCRMYADDVQICKSSDPNNLFERMELTNSHFEAIRQ